LHEEKKNKISFAPSSDKADKWLMGYVEKVFEDSFIALRKSLHVIANDKPIKG